MKRLAFGITLAIIGLCQVTSRGNEMQSTRPVIPDGPTDDLATLCLRLDESISRLKEFSVTLPSTRPTNLVLLSPPTDMPPGSSRRKFNGFTYYIVPLGK